jgi:hypothetical protein
MKKTKTKPSRKHASENQKKMLYLLVFGFIVVYCLSILIRDLSRSLFFQRQDRINIVVYSAKPTYYSFGIAEVGNYALSFYPDLRVQIPGGYGYYRVGALGKLVQLEKEPVILQKAFSAVTSTAVDYYFYEDSDQVYYGSKGSEQQQGQPELRDLFFMKSNASLIDKIYLLALLNQIKPNTVYEIDYLPYDQVKDDTVFDSKTFLSKYIGTFYQKTYRNENLNVQIVYTNSYKTADVISSILNGNGILVGDISQQSSEEKKCTVIEEDRNTKSKTAELITDYFGCVHKKGETGIYDILFVLGSLEKTWSMK